MARCQVVPPSIDTSTAPTTPPPVSEAVPETVTGYPTVTVDPEAGDVICDFGAVKSVEAVAATSPD